MRVDAKHANSRAGFHIMNASLNGSEVACLNCQEHLFVDWVKQVANKAALASGSASVAADPAHGKHPNSPGYDKWKKESKLSFLGVSAPKSGATSEEPEVQVSHTHGWDIAPHQSRLQTLWAQRRLVVGYGAEPGARSMNFIEALVSLGRESPELTPANCDRTKSSHCDALLSGDRTASASELRGVLDETFGKEFLDKHAYRSDMSDEKQRSHLKELLSALKSKYSFYYQKCLSHQPGTETCDRKASSQLLGRIPCRPEDDELSDDCVYSEVRLCDSCGDGRRFFEYARFHGPLALFATATERHGVMGQCEEFSRAGHALLSSLGYKTRYVLDFTDHVWVEVWLHNPLQTGESEGAGKWVHADPSEGVLDSPLMYEKGWGKQLTMIFAFTPHHIEHITHRYTADYKETVGRRGISENDLAVALTEANRRLTKEFPLTKFGYTYHESSRDRTLDEIALWSHFEVQ